MLLLLKICFQVQIQDVKFFIQLNIFNFYLQIPLIVSCTMHFEPHQTMFHLLNQIEFSLLKI